MVKTNLIWNKIMTGIFFAIILSLNSFSQENNTLQFGKHYHQWGISLSPLLYHKGETNLIHANYKFIPKNMPSFSIGLEYNIKFEQPWSYKTGLLLALEPSYYYYLNIPKEDLISYGWKEELIMNSKLELLTPSLSIPIGLEYKRALTTNKFITFGLGCNFKFFPVAKSDQSIWAHNEDDTVIAEIFATYTKTTNDGFFQPSLQFKTGIYFVSKKILIHNSFIFNKSLKNLFQGEYQFNFLDNSESTRDNYIISGDYIGLSTTLFFKRKNRQ